MKKKKLYALPARYHARKQRSEILLSEPEQSPCTDCLAKQVFDEHKNILWHIGQLSKDSQGIHWQLKQLQAHRLPNFYDRTELLIESKFRETNRSVANVKDEIDLMKWSFPLLRKDLTVNMIRTMAVTLLMNASFTAALLWFMR